MSKAVSSDAISHKTWAAALINPAHHDLSRGNPLLELKSKIVTPQSAEPLGRLHCGMVKRVKAELTDGFDFSSLLPTPLEVTAIREALEAGLLGFPSHAVRAARDDGVTALQVLNVVRVGVPVQKDFPDHQSRTAGISFEGRAGGSRRVRVKISWNDYYYVVTVHSVKRIKRKTVR